MSIFLILAHWWNQLVYVNNPESKEAKDLYWYSRISTYFTVFVIQLSHLWFVNDPEESYPKAFGFVGHYIPYALFQTALAAIAIMQASLCLYYWSHLKILLTIIYLPWYCIFQVKYDIVTNTIPYGVSKGLARRYVVYLILLTIVYQTVVIAILCGKPIIDARNGGWETTAFTVIVKLYALASMVIPIASSIWTIKHSGDTNSFKMAIQWKKMIVGTVSL